MFPSSLIAILRPSIALDYCSQCHQVKLPLHCPRRPKDRATLNPKERHQGNVTFPPSRSTQLLHLMCTAADQQPTPETYSLIRRAATMALNENTFHRPLLPQRCPTRIRPMPSSAASCNPLAILLVTPISFVSSLAVPFVRNILTLAPNPPYHPLVDVLS
ncbi:hypothetical protein B0T20DRAFT_135869 [Sordaria brevicollis]|uniref:Uncharacterized protein n=1 Tax=Sordaria brevicollis TaxID=83679 RepID=A0AAE0UFJ5_SORBR|nr:hypothetical protein B0T20DRAFT_135869 [Sordaria brevicollis]